MIKWVEHELQVTTMQDDFLENDNNISTLIIIFWTHNYQIIYILGLIGT